MSEPLNFTMPWVGEINLFSNRRKVLFPEPEGPIIPVMPLVSIATLIFERITLPSISKQTSSN